MWIPILLFFILLNIITFFIPKRLKKSEMYATTFFALTFGGFVDEILDLHLNMYGYFQRGFQWAGFIGSILYFIPVNLLFLNFFPFTKGLQAKIVYILLWSISSILFEWLALQTEFFYHNSWKLWYSAIAYPFIFVILVVNLKFFKGLSK